MKFLKFCFMAVILIAPALHMSAQTKSATISGIIKNRQNQPIESVSVYLKSTTNGVLSDSNGEYKLSVAPGKHTVVAYILGYKSKEQSVTVTGNENQTLNISLDEDETSLKEVLITGKTSAQTVREMPFYVNAIETKKYTNTSSDLNQILNRISGVRIRESGGVGSNFTFSLNGFSGNQIRFFIDGVPMDNLGSSFQMNNIPINLADRIDVYKGVVPISLGADALGGAINIITNPNRENYLDASYSYGSFNTHRTSINFGYTTKSGFTVQLNAFQNYSDNDYKVDVEVADLVTGLYTPMRVKRFHDTYHNETVIGKVGLVNKSFADALLVGITLGKNKADIQTGNRMYDVYGGRETKGDIIMPSIRYAKKDLFTKGLDVSLNGNFNFGTEQTIDTLYRQYNWLGEFVYKNPSNPNAVGGENSRTLYKYRNNNGLLVTNFNYKLSDQHLFTVNHTLNTFNRKGEDRLNPDNQANKMPKKSDKNIIGLSYQYIYNEKWTTMLFLKEYFQHNKSHRVYNDEYYIQSNNINKSGYGIASTYFFNPDFQIKASYEKSLRLPENDEMFGDEVNLESNYDLRPEHGNNFNLGGSYNLHLNQVHTLYFETNLIYRNTTDFIRAQVSVSGDRAKKKMVNMGKVETKGIDAEIRYSYKKNFVIGANITFQDITNQNKADGPVYQDRIPNIPYLYGNGNVSYLLENIGKKGNSLRFDYNLLYVHEYYLRWPSQGISSSKATIPEQIAHDVAVIYSFHHERYNLAFECRNLTDAILYDNFSLQKPSRFFSIKFRYFISKF